MKVNQRKRKARFKGILPAIDDVVHKIFKK